MSIISRTEEHSFQNNRQLFTTLNNLLFYRRPGPPEGGGLQILSEKIRNDFPKSTHWDRLKRRFLDRFAEFVAHKSHGRHVSSAAMSILNYGVRIWVTRNDHFEDSRNDVMFLENTFPGLLNDHISSPTNMAIRDRIWEEMVLYSTPRIKAWIRKPGKELFNSLANFNWLIGIVEDWNEPDAIIPQSELTQQLINFKTQLIDGGQDTTDREHQQLVYQQLVENAHALRRPMTTLRNSVSYRLDDSERQVLSTLCTYIGFLGRLRRAYWTFMNCISEVNRNSTMNSTQIVLIECINTAKPTTPTRDQASRLLQAVHSFDITDSHFPFRAAQDSFNIDQIQTPTFHAEIQMAIYFSTLDSVEIGNVVKYIGCSKYSCLPCWLFLKGYIDLQHQKYLTRGCHGKLYPKCAVPPGKYRRITRKNARPIDNAVVSAITELSKYLRNNELGELLDPEDESSYGGSGSSSHCGDDGNEINSDWEDCSEGLSDWESTSERS